MDELRRALQSLSDANRPQFYLLSGVVKAVNNKNYTCDVLPDDGSPLLYDVRLRSTIDEDLPDFVLIPEEKSKVIVGMLDKSNALVVQCGTVSKIISFGGNRGGMLYSDKVLPLLEDINTKLTAIVNVLNSGVILEAGNGSPSALQSAMRTALQTATKIPLNDFENKKFIQ